MSDEQSVAEIAARLGRAQRRTILSLTGRWGKAASHQCARRMFWGIRGGHYLVEHKHKTDNCWRLTSLGLLVRTHLKDTPNVS